MSKSQRQSSPQADQEIVLGDHKVLECKKTSCFIYLPTNTALSHPPEGDCQCESGASLERNMETDQLGGRNLGSGILRAKEVLTSG